MNRYLLMSAATLLVTTCAAKSAVYSFAFGTAYGGCYCDSGMVTTGVGGGFAAAWIHNGSGLCTGTSSSQGAGLLQRVKGLGKVWALSDNDLAKNYGVYDAYLEYTLPKHLANGARWTMWFGFSGVSNFEANSGALWFVEKGEPVEKPRGTTSTLAKVKQLLALHRE